MTEQSTDTARGTGKFGCIGLTAVLVIGLLLVVVSTWRLHRHVAAYEARFSGPEWVRLEGQAIEETEPITEPTLIFGPEIVLHGATEDIAIQGGDAELHGHYTGNVFFLGRNFDLAPDGVVEGVIEVSGARHVTIRGISEGGVEGAWDRLYQSTPPAKAP
ncbi:MAG: hypothetical protein QF733_06515 [Phycisphaerales bacterium]|jgi:hypothetical protein|nr:hypothetical protein [Phycisphaerales bacterium]